MEALKDRHILAVAVGNTRTRLGLFVNGELQDVQVAPSAASADVLAAAHAIKDHAGVAVTVGQ
jgi:hypothetical protein